MVDGQVPDDVAEFAAYLHELLSSLDPETGWYGVFAQRDAEGLRACLDGREVLPWDVVDALLRDVALRHGTAAAERERPRARALHRASVAAYDRHIGGREALLDALDVMLRERQFAASRERELSTALEAAGSPAEREPLAAELAWARDDHERASARCAELRTRLDALPPAAGQAPGRAEPAAPARSPREDPEADALGHGTSPARESAAASGGRGSGPADARPASHGSAAAPLRGARFAGAAGTPQPAASSPPTAPAPTQARAAKPRGARFAGAYEQPDAAPRNEGARRREKESRRAPRPPRKDEAAALAAARRESAQAVARLAELRASGRSGEAHVVLCEAAAWPADRLPPLLAELERAGLAADVATLLWEAGSLPPPALAAAACALADAGRAEDCRLLLRQSVARPPADVAETALALRSADRTAEAGALLDTLLRVRTTEEAAEVALTDPGALVPSLLAAAAGVSSHRHRDLAHALRAAGVPGVPEAV